MENITLTRPQYICNSMSRISTFVFPHCLYCYTQWEPLLPGLFIPIDWLILTLTGASDPKNFSLVFCLILSVFAVHIEHIA